MEMAKRNAVRYRRLSERVRIRHDVRRLQQFLTLETGTVVMLSGIELRTLGLKIPCGPTNGTRFPL
jgi:hypothetical protein